MRVELDRVVRMLPDDDDEVAALTSLTRTAEIEIVRTELEKASRDADDAWIKSELEDSRSLTVIVEWFQNLAGAEWQWN